MHHYLRQHPNVFMPAIKEPHYFAPDLAGPGFLRDRGEYLSLFADAGAGQAVGEASVWYLFSSVAAPLIRRASPEARAVVMLRNPIELMRSLHSRNVAFGNETVPDFEAALALEPERAEGRLLPPLSPFPESLLYSRVARLGEQVERLLRIFLPGEVHFVVLEELAADPAHAYASTLRFLGLPDWRPQTFEAVNPNRRPRSAALGGVLYEGRFSVRAAARRVLSPRRRLQLRSTGLVRSFVRASAPTAVREDLPVVTSERLRQSLAADVALLSRFVGRDLARLWWGERSSGQND
jgi:hypothetical protein